MLQKLIRKQLERYVKRYFRRHPNITLIVVAGSVGKTSTKRAIATLLYKRYRVRLEKGNHNTALSAPLAILGVQYPDNVRSVLNWLRVFSAARASIRARTQPEVIIQEIGADKPGDIAAFGTYLTPDIGIVSAVTPEHMQYFETIEAVAKEELSAANFSKTAIINRDDIDGKFADYLDNPSIVTYGTTSAAEYHFEPDTFRSDSGYSGIVYGPKLREPLNASIFVFGEHSIRSCMAAVAVAAQLGVSPESITAGLAEIRPVPGRMNVLKGVDDSIIIDDSYNSSPVAASAALQVLFGLQAPQRIAVLGDMNELGVSSEAEHYTLGNMCDPSLLAWVVTVGQESEKYLAPAARARGCQVKSFGSSIDAAVFIRKVMEHGSAILVKGSQSNVYTEEIVKIIALGNQSDQIVRQSPSWIIKKEKFFSRFQ